MNNTGKLETMHLIITRFNIPLKHQVLNNQIDCIDVRTDTHYLSYRFSLFEKYTVPSIKGQTNKNFFWVILFSKFTPKEFCEKINTLQKELPNFIPLFLSDEDDPQKAIVKLVNRYQFETLITSRIDNDDALNKYFVETIQSSIIKSQKTELLIFPNGIQYDCDRKLMTNYYFPKNHFSTLVCQNKFEIKTILGYDHMKISKCFPVRYLRRDVPMWLEIVHGGNILNRMYLNFKNLNFNFSQLSLFGQSEIPDKPYKFIVYIFVIFNKPHNAYRLIKSYGVKKIFCKILNKFKKEEYL